MTKNVFLNNKFNKQGKQISKNLMLNREKTNLTKYKP